ncbi:hypothetical protein [Granulicella sp. dw_53]|uniref:hypothetical protein n=1 Tax=Granulicella sp. dw_53 TaxID=2719792 RepID=UPI001BD36F33|nr:hypothetical protein [Granulicella sp. dw_53]
MANEESPALKALPIKPSNKILSDGLKWCLIASVIILLGSLAMFVTNVVAGFAYFNERTAPLWVTVLGVVSIIGIALGFGGLFLVFLLAAAKSRRDGSAKAVAAE